MGERLLYRSENDQRKVGNSKHQASVPKCVEISQVPGPRGRVLRGGEDGKNQAAILLRSKHHLYSDPLENIK